MLNVSTVTLLSIRVRSSTQNYKYRVRAVNSNGVTGPYSASVVVPNDISGLPTSPSNVTFDAGSITPTTVRVRWQIPLLGKNENATFQVRLYPINGGGGGAAAATPRAGCGCARCRRRPRRRRGQLFASWSRARRASRHAHGGRRGAQPDTFTTRACSPRTAALAPSAATYDSQVMMPPARRTCRRHPRRRALDELYVSASRPTTARASSVTSSPTASRIRPPTRRGRRSARRRPPRSGAPARRASPLRRAARTSSRAWGATPASPAEGAGLHTSSSASRQDELPGARRGATASRGRSRSSTCVCAGDACPVTPDEDRCRRAPHRCGRRRPPTPRTSPSSPTRRSTTEPQPRVDEDSDHHVDAPFAHYLPLLDVQLSTVQAGTSDISVADLPPTATAFNLTDLMPATHERGALPQRDRLEQWRRLPRRSPTPGVPPSATRCITSPSTSGSGRPTPRRFIQRRGAGRLPAQRHRALHRAGRRRRTPLALDVLRADVLTYSNYLLTHTTPYNVTVRANSLGWGRGRGGRRPRRRRRTCRLPVAAPRDPAARPRPPAHRLHDRLEGTDLPRSSRRRYAASRRRTTRSRTTSSRRTRRWRT